MMQRGQGAPRYQFSDLSALWMNLYCNEVMSLRMSSSEAPRHLITPSGTFYGDDAIHVRAAQLADAYVERVRQWVASAGPTSGTAC